MLNADDPRVVSMAALTAARVVWFGLGADADVRATDIAAHARGTDFTVTAPDGASPLACASACSASTTS